MSASLPKSVVLLSGGLDSSTTLALAKRDGFAPYVLTSRYGQRHAHEVDAARRIALAAGVVSHVVLEIGLSQFGGSALTADIAVPKDRDVAGSASGEIPITYVPARNTIFLSYALAWAEVLDATDIHIGVNAQDYSGYPDCRPEYIRAYERMANLATRAAVAGDRGDRPLRIHTPLMALRKREIIELGSSLGVDYGLTTSCYDPTPDGLACGRCDACQLRRKGFADAGLRDPIAYAEAFAAPGSLTHSP
ncbi:MAG: 7-cyano-7-deazaguanine synthase QueC [Gemmatimonadaceae bacterium]